MPLALRNLDTGLFFAHGQWTPYPKLAQDFSDFEEAKKAAIELNLKNADVVTIHVDGRVRGGWTIQISN